MSDMKCPFCQQELDYLELDYLGEDMYGCRKHNYLFGNEKLWQELIRTRKMLKIAVGAIETIKYSKKSDAINLRHKANKALIEIWKIKDQTALEQKDVK